MVLLNKKEAPLNTNRKYIFIPLLIFVTVSSLVLSILSVKDLEWEDHIPLETGVMLYIYGLIFFTASYETSNHLFFHTSTGRALIEKNGLSQGIVMEINNKIISTIQALYCCITGLTSICYSCPKDMLRTSHYLSEGYAWFGAAYFLYDIWSMFKVQNAMVEDELNAELTNGETKNGVKTNRYEAKEDRRSFTNSFMYFLKKNPVIVGHHIFIGGFGFLVMTYFRGNLGDCFFGFIYLMEASTPFVSFRSIISKMGYKNSRFYVVNGILMMASFFLFRVLMWPIGVLLYAYSINKSYIEAINLLPKGCKISILILMLPQFYWFALIVKGAFQFGKAKKKTKEA